MSVFPWTHLIAPRSRCSACAWATRRSPTWRAGRSPGPGRALRRRNPDARRRSRVRTRAADRERARLLPGRARTPPSRRPRAAVRLHLRIRRLGDASVLSSSPERFLRVGRDRVVESRPMKGTAARVAEPYEDACRAAELRRDKKTRAENLMIADLVRNDLGRVSALGTVEVPKLMVVEPYATVHQMVTVVRGRLRDDADALDCVRAAFPAGSMTGAPKLRTLEIIDRLEGRPRGVYSGALGFFAVNGTADLSVVIRTLVASPDGLTIGAGGAIVAGSDPEAELEEMLLKARPLLEAVGGTLETGRELAAAQPS